MGCDVTIRGMKLNNLPRVLAIERQCFPLNNSLGPLLYYWLVDRGGLRVAEVDGDVVGYVFSRRTLLGRLGRCGHIVAVAVEKEFRRRGIGRRLMEAALDHLAQRRVSRVGLEVRQSNTAAQALYEQLGFDRIGVSRGYYADGEDACQMVKRVSPAAARHQDSAA